MLVSSLLIIIRLTFSAMLVSANEIRVPPVVDFFSDPSADARRYDSSNPSDHFRLLHADDDHVAIGGADFMYNISVKTFGKVFAYPWSSTSSALKDCTMKSSDETVCHNYVRVLAQTSNGSRLICGTNAFHPRCRLHYSSATLAGESPASEFVAVGLLPFDPRHNATARMDGDFLYASTTSDFAGTDSLIFRRDVAAARRDAGLRTQRHNDVVLNRPHFVGQLHTDEYAYFFFREEANEVDGAPATFSRVARICKRDRGGPRNYYETEWTSFVKARLNCSIPERNRPFYFDEIVAISEVRQSADGRMIFYATFVSEFDFLRHSVVCAFDLSAIDQLFANSDLLVLESERRAAAKWTRQSRNDPVRRLAGQCQVDSRTLAEESAVQLRRLTLMADSVPSAFPAGAIGIRQAADRYGQIAVLKNIKFHDGIADVLYVATDQGNIIKMVNLVGFYGRRSLATDEDPLIHVATFKIPKTPIRDLIVNSRWSALIAVTDTALFRLPLAACGEHATCAACVASRDPHCVWHDFACVKTPPNIRKRFTYQDVLMRKPRLCEVAAHDGKEKSMPPPVVRIDVANNVRYNNNYRSDNSVPSATVCRCADGLLGCACDGALVDETWTNANGTTAFNYLRSLLPGSVRSAEFGALPLWAIVVVALAAVQTLAFAYFCCKLTATRQKRRDKKVNVVGRDGGGARQIGASLSTNCDTYDYSNRCTSYGKLPGYSYSMTRSLNCCEPKRKAQYIDADERAVVSATLGRPPTIPHHQLKYSNYGMSALTLPTSGLSTYFASTLPSMSSTASTNVTHLSSFCDSRDASLVSVTHGAPHTPLSVGVQLRMSPTGMAIRA